MKKFNRKRFLIYFSLIAILLTCLQLYFLENRISLIIHLKDCDYPNNIEDIEINSSFNPFDDYATGSFLLNKNDLKDWLIEASFEVIIFEDREGNTKFIVNKEEIPIEILNGQIDFGIQFLHSNQERTLIDIKAIDDGSNALVSLVYNPT